MRKARIGAWSSDSLVRGALLTQPELALAGDYGEY